MIAIVCISVIILALAGVAVYFLWKYRKSYASAFNFLNCRLSTKCMENTAIPKVIYRTAKTKSLSPAHQQAWDFTAKHNPDFEQVLLDDNDADAFMRTAMDGEAYAAYSSLVPGAAKADLLRYVLLLSGARILQK